MHDYFNIVAELFCQSVDKALGCGVKCIVLNKLNYADFEFLSVGAFAFALALALARLGAGLGLFAAVRAAGGHCGHHCSGKNGCDNLFKFHFYFLRFSQKNRRSPLPQ